ncbi:hypothetical protein JNW90_00020 [Micromonospora sp. STR1s_5]|nr:hypothetical protein [Micromonospora sp. STR1s_5]
MAVHTDDLAVSLGLPTPPMPQTATETAIQLLSSLAAWRHGSLRDLMGGRMLEMVNFYLATCCQRERRCRALADGSSVPVVPDVCRMIFGPAPPQSRADTF